MSHMATDNMDKQSNTLAVVMLAGAIGAVVGMLMAPKRGSEMREELIDKYFDTKNRAQNNVESAKSKAAETMDAAKDKVHDVADKAKEVVDRSADKTTDAADKVTERAKNQLDEAESRPRRGRSPLDE